MEIYIYRIGVLRRSIFRLGAANLNYFAFLAASALA